MPKLVDRITGGYEPVPNRKRWTRAQCDFLRDNGLLTERYELIDGEIVDKMGQKPPHSVTLTLLYTWLITVLGGFVRVQLPIDVGSADPEHNEPEPDVAVTMAPMSAYASRHPGPVDLVAVAEVSDTTLRYDLTAKAALYARAGIREYWVLDVIDRRVLIHREPIVGGYAEIVAYGPEESVAAPGRAEVSVRVGDLLPAG